MGYENAGGAGFNFWDGRERTPPQNLFLLHEHTHTTAELVLAVTLRPGQRKEYDSISISPERKQQVRAYYRAEQVERAEQSMVRQEVTTISSIIMPKYGSDISSCILAIK